ncbi:unnamed protein product [Mytilus coruscus]|uniref:Uncharacterized protein n=1 Tax=Mytilus coruscus TaxID=42192 RepID=A0A6J8BNZ8_MYTCO|nr:unnamed protein product [Mytilus coruscus]
MNNNIIPLRHSSLPGDVRLPKRYEQLEEMTTERKGRLSTTNTADETISERLDDLSQAMVWVKHELILLRQHDILLKRQFGDIQDTINSLHKCKHRSQRHKSSNLSLHSNCSSIDISLDNYTVRTANSITLLNDDECDDNFDTEMTFRPRTSSMKTTRDLAALARRRGSKDLI